MNIHNIYRIIFKIWRKKRMLLFESIIQPDSSEVLLDVGGVPETWTKFPQRTKKIDCLNTYKINWEPANKPDYRITTIIGNGCSLPFENKEYDILFSNSVIEHVGGWENQQAFANEARRVGKKLWIQTPALECPIEPHYMAFFVHWFPVKIRRKLLRRLTPWGWMVKPSLSKIDETIAFTQLLSKKQFQTLFPDCEIITERLLGIIPKSYIAFRTQAATDSNSLKT